MTSHELTKILLEWPDREVDIEHDGSWMFHHSGMDGNQVVFYLNEEVAKPAVMASTATTMAAS